MKPEVGVMAFKIGWGEGWGEHGREDYICLAYYYKN